HRQRLDARELVDDVIGLERVPAREDAADAQRGDAACEQPRDEARQRGAAVPAIPAPAARSPHEREALLGGQPRGHLSLGARQEAVDAVAEPREAVQQLGGDAGHAAALLLRRAGAEPGYAKRSA